MSEEFRGGLGKPGVLFVCMGNICRSPTAEGVFRHKAERAGLLERLVVDSAGTHGYHEGFPPDRRAIAVARKRGYDLTALRARQLVAADFLRFDYVLGMDAHNLREMQLLRARMGMRAMWGACWSSPRSSASSTSRIRTTATIGSSRPSSTRSKSRWTG